MFSTLTNVKKSINASISCYNNIKQEVELLMTMLGVKKETAVVVIAEMGTDMSVFETSERTASWTGLSPANDKQGYGMADPPKNLCKR